MKRYLDAAIIRPHLVHRVQQPFIQAITGSLGLDHVVDRYVHITALQCSVGTDPFRIDYTGRQAFLHTLQ